MICGNNDGANSSLTRREDRGRDFFLNEYGYYPQGPSILFSSKINGQVIFLKKQMMEQGPYLN